MRVYAAHVSVHRLCPARRRPGGASREHRCHPQPVGSQQPSLGAAFATAGGHRAVCLVHAGSGVRFSSLVFRDAGVSVCIGWEEG